VVSKLNTDDTDEPNNPPGWLGTSFAPKRLLFCFY